MTDQDKVKVTYPDGEGNHETTVGELRIKWIAETTEWRNAFFFYLEKDGVAFSNWAEYKLLTNE